MLPSWFFAASENGHPLPQVTKKQRTILLPPTRGNSASTALMHSRTTLSYARPCCFAASPPNWRCERLWIALAFPPNTHQRRQRIESRKVFRVPDSCSLSPGERMRVRGSAAQNEVVLS